MTVSKHTLPMLATGIKFLHSLGFQIEGNLAYGLDWSDRYNVSLLSKQLDELISFYIDNPNLLPCGMLSMDIQRVSPHSVPIKKWCGVGTDMVAVDVDGRDYPCHLFEPLSLGQHARTMAEMDFADSSSLKDTRCSECVLLPICPTCYGINLLKNGNPAIREKALCTLTKVRALACSKMQALKLKLPCHSAVEDVEIATTQLRIIRAIKTIQTSIAPTI
jgi:radical SAM protein with 4Fe4S-binding SPASM domain